MRTPIELLGEKTNTYAQALNPLSYRRPVMLMRIFNISDDSFYAVEGFAESCEYGEDEFGRLTTTYDIEYCIVKYERIPEEEEEIWKNQYVDWYQNRYKEVLP